MTAQQQVLAPPVLKEAINGVLYVGQLTGPVAHGSVAPYLNATEGDKVEFTVQTSTGNSWDRTITLTTIGSPIDFAIPKATFAEKLKPGATATATLNYTITRASGDSVPSLDLTVQIKP
ncbi:hypothetical protein [Pseudomonas sp. FP1742]|uniref:hypothetical protein n=1 Tax=Pseudomonas sp. FP1742 TaxID=2954079 RepID=UPI0027330286|nr:hypothetical protein [Pseudomonas sp. FP1742]WLG51746.1 hypothetical protein PSH64_04315 [Pseudomonas sp. FP1742]